METPSISPSPVQVQFPPECDSLLDRCVLIMHTMDPIEKADLTLLLGEQWRASISARKDMVGGLRTHLFFCCMLFEKKIPPMLIAHSIPE